MATQAPPLPHPRRLVTAQTGPDTAIFQADGPVEMKLVPYTTYLRGASWVVEAFPVDNSDVHKQTTPPDVSQIVQPEGAAFYYLDIPPSTPAYVHFTTSLDLGVVIHGEVVVELPPGDKEGADEAEYKRTLKAGDSLVQRGNLHGLGNESETEWARLLVVVMQAKELTFEKDGKLDKVNGTQFP